MPRSPRSRKASAKKHHNMNPPNSLASSSTNSLLRSSNNVLDKASNVLSQSRNRTDPLSARNPMTLSTIEGNLALLAAFKGHLGEINSEWLTAFRIYSLNNEYLRVCQSGIQLDRAEGRKHVLEMLVSKMQELAGCIIALIPISGYASRDCDRIMAQYEMLKASHSIDWFSWREIFVDLVTFTNDVLRNNAIHSFIESRYYSKYLE